MGLASALTTALTGLTAAETQIDVVGNNLANSQTVGFKSSKVVFATQFMQTLGLGSAPSATSGGTNPRQTGLGVQVAEVSPNFNQGTIEISASPTDLAIQGDGFFMVDSSTGERLYTRNGIFKTNANNELVDSTGNRLLGYGVDDSFSIQTTELVSLTIPLGTAAVAQATENVFLQGVLTPTGDIADTAEVIESTILGNGAIGRPDIAGVTIGVGGQPNVTGITGASTNVGGGVLTPGDVYQYKFVYFDDGATTDSEGVASDAILAAAVGAGDDSITLSARPPAAGGYTKANVYRTEPGGSEFYFLETIDADGSPYVDDGVPALTVGPATLLNEDALTGNYSYRVVYSGPGVEDSRPSDILGGAPITVVDGRIQIQNFPAPPAPPPAYTAVRVYRNLANDPSSYYLVAELNPGESFTDSRTDADISDLTISGNKALDLEGPRADSTTLLVNLVRREGFNYENLFEEGTLTFSAKKGGRAQQELSFTITDTTNVQELIDFMQHAMGIQTTLDDPQHPLSNSLNTIPGETGDLAPGGTIVGGKIRFVSNNGTANALSIGLSAFQVKDSIGDLSTANLGFGSIQTAKGQSAVTDFVVYDSLGIPLNLRLTAVLESRTASGTVYRWFADAPGNDPLDGVDTSVGTGLVTFDGSGNFVSATNETVSIERRHVPSITPLELRLDFSQISGLANPTSSLAASRQDGSGPGTLSSFIIGEDGVIRGVFSNGVSRDLGQIRLARFSNNGGLEQRGNNLFAAGVNTGLPIEGNPSDNGIGSIRSGALELSNSDIGKNLIDLILATTQYRGNSRVITASQQLLDELLNLRR